MPWPKFQTQPTSDADVCDEHRRWAAWDFGTRPDRDLVGPHSNRELGLMIAGKKPLAFVDSTHFRDGWRAEVERRGWSWCHMLPLHGRAEDHVLVCLPGHERRFSAMNRVYSSCRRRNAMTATDHAKVGILLGYTKEQIRAFLGKISYRLAA